MIFFECSEVPEGFGNDKKTHRQNTALLKADTWLYGKSDYDLRLNHQTCRRIYGLPGDDVCGFFVSQNEKLVLDIRNKITFNHAPNARQFRPALSEKTYMRKAELPRQIFILFCCLVCCCVLSSFKFLNPLHLLLIMTVLEKYT